MRRALPIVTLAVLLLLAACKEEVAAPAIPPAAPPLEAPVPAAEPEQEAALEPEALEGSKWVEADQFGVKFRVPEEWVVNDTPEGVTAVDEDETITVVLVGSESGGMIQEAISDVQKKVAIKDAKLDRTTNVMLNKFPAQSVRGQALLTKTNGDDQEIEFLAYNVKVGSGAVTMMIFAEAEMYEAKLEIIEGLAKTLERAS